MESRIGFPDLRSTSLYSALRASLWPFKIAPGDFVAAQHPGYDDVIKS